MRWLDCQIKLPLPPARMRWPALLGIGIAWSLIPTTGSDLTMALTCCAFPMLIAICTAGYWRSSSLLTLLFVTFITTIAAFALRTMLAPLYDSIGSFSHFFTTDWRGRGLLLVPLGVQLFMVSLTLLPFHFLLRRRHAKAA